MKYVKTVEEEEEERNERRGRWTKKRSGGWMRSLRMGESTAVIGKSPSPAAKLQRRKFTADSRRTSALPRLTGHLLYESPRGNQADGLPRASHIFLDP